MAFIRWRGSGKAAMVRALRGVVLGLGVVAGSVLALEKGAPAPDFALSGAEQTISLAQYRGKVVYLDFWASWCGPCRQSFPWMNAMQAKYGGQGLQVLAINLDVKPADAQKFLSVNPASFAVAYDPQGQTPRRYGVKSMPSSFLIDRNGRIHALQRGFEPEEGAALEQQIRLALERAP